jgi:hypothetical protein
MMKTTALGLILGTMFAVGAAQAQPAKLTTSQMDQVTAGQITITADEIGVQANISRISQRVSSDVDACGDAGSACNVSGTDFDADLQVRARSDVDAANVASVTQSNTMSFGN